jgi:protein-disulfide isomerase
MSLAANLRRVLIGAMLAFAAGAASAATVPASEPDDMAMGSARAPVTVIEYASVGCPHCALWSNTVFPRFKARFVDTGRVRFVVREMLTGSPALASAGFMLARCAGPARYFEVVDAIYRHQAAMFLPGVQMGPALQQIAKAVGMTQAAFDACIDDQKGLDAVNARSERHVNVDKIDSTPIFFVGGKEYEGEQTLAQLTAAIAAANHSR